MIYFNLIELMTRYSSCPLCRESLDPYISNGSLNSYNILVPSINCLLKNNLFTFNCKYTSARLDTNIQIIIDSQGAIFYQSNEKICIDDFINIFLNLYLRLELRCQNTKCKNHYGLYTSILKITEKQKQFFLSSFYIDMEGFSLSKFWIQNDLTNNKTIIYNRKKITFPITIDLIDFHSQTKEKLFNKIKMNILFS